jgi:hypothetical protein
MDPLRDRYRKSDPGDTDSAIFMPCSTTKLAVNVIMINKTSTVSMTGPAPTPRKKRYRPPVFAPTFATIVPPRPADPIEHEQIETERWQAAVGRATFR